MITSKRFKVAALMVACIHVNLTLLSHQFHLKVGVRDTYPNNYWAALYSDMFHLT